MAQQTVGAVGLAMTLRPERAIFCCVVRMNASKAGEKESEAGLPWP